MFYPKTWSYVPNTTLQRQEMVNRYGRMNFSSFYIVIMWLVQAMFLIWKIIILTHLGLHIHEIWANLSSPALNLKQLVIYRCHMSSTVIICLRNVMIVIYPLNTIVAGLYFIIGHFTVVIYRTNTIVEGLLLEFNHTRVTHASGSH